MGITGCALTAKSLVSSRTINLQAQICTASLHAGVPKSAIQPPFTKNTPENCSPGQSPHPHKNDMLLLWRGS